MKRATQRSLRERVKSGLAVGAITILIWAAADQNVSEEQSFSCLVRMTSASPSRYAGFAEAPFQTTFNITAVGRRRHLKDFSAVIASKDVFEAVVDEVREASRSVQTLSGREILAMIKPIDSANVRIRSVEPSTVLVRVDEYETVSDIKVACDFGELKAAAQPTPAMVSVRLPRFAAERLLMDPVARVEAEQRIRQARKADGTFSIRAPLVFEALRGLDPDLKIEVLPSAEVQITGQIEALTVTRRKGPVQITWSIPDQVQEDFRVVPDPSINLRPDIDLTGPKELLEHLEAREIRAFIDVMAADMEKPNTPIRRAVQFILPTGISLAAGRPPLEVVFQLEPRATARGATGQ